MSRIIHLHDPPWEHSSTNLLPFDFNDIFRPDNGKGHQAAEFVVLLDSVFVIFFDVVGEVVDWDLIVIYIFHDEFFGGAEFLGG
jgi:hypothetical protein